MIGDSQDKDALITRLHRIEGQVRGIERMVDDDRYCIDILQQIAAARSALERVGAQLLEGHVNHCIASALATNDGREAAAKASEMLAAVQRFVRSG